MTIQELKTILNLANVGQNQKVRVRLYKPDGNICEITDITSFETFSDGICLDVEPNIIERLQ